MGELDCEGAHQGVSTKCGHVFGRSCITTWLTSGINLKKRTCPICNTVASVHDLRLLFGLSVNHPEESRLQILELEKRIADETALHALSKHQIGLLIEQRTGQYPSIPTVSQSASIPPAGRLKEIFSRAVGVPGRSVAFDVMGRLVFTGTSGSDRAISSSTQRTNLRCVNFVQEGNVETIASMPFRGIVTHLNICKNIASPSFRQLAMVSNRSVSVVSQDLKNTMQLGHWLDNSQAPTCTTWMDSNPHALVVGFQNGVISTFDMRATSRGPLYRLKVSLDENCHVNSLAEVRIQEIVGVRVERALVIGSCDGLYAARVNGRKPLFRKVLDVGTAKQFGAVMSGDQISVGYLENDMESVTIYHGIRDVDNTLLMGTSPGPALTRPNYLSPLFLPGAFHGPNVGDPTVVVWPDGRSIPGMSCWSQQRPIIDWNISRPWTPVPIVRKNGRHHGSRPTTRTFHDALGISVSTPIEDGCFSDAIFFACYGEKQLSVYSYRPE